MNGEAGEDPVVWFGRAVQHYALTLLHTAVYVTDMTQGREWEIYHWFLEVLRAFCYNYMYHIYRVFQIKADRESKQDELQWHQDYTCIVGSWIADIIIVF